jgi:hypothetical protein
MALIKKAAETTVMSSMEVHRYVAERLRKYKETHSWTHRMLSARVEEGFNRADDALSEARYTNDVVTEMKDDIQWLRTQVKCLRGQNASKADPIGDAPSPTADGSLDFLGYKRGQRSGQSWTKAESDWLEKMFEDEMSNRFMTQGFKHIPDLIQEVLRDLAGCNGRTAWANECQLNRLGYTLSS